MKIKQFFLVSFGAWVFFSPVFAERMTLGDMSEPSKRNKANPSESSIRPRLNDTKTPPPTSAQTAPAGRFGAPRSYKKAVRSMQASSSPSRAVKTSVKKNPAADKRYKQLDAALEQKKWSEAESIATRLLAVDERNSAVSAKRDWARKHLSENLVAMAEKKQKAGDIHGAIGLYETAFSYRNDPDLRERINNLRRASQEQNKKKTDQLYLEALTATQRGDASKALQLCEEVLQLNPSHLQAQRMRQRLQSKVR